MPPGWELLDRGRHGAGKASPMFPESAGIPSLNSPYFRRNASATAKKGLHLFAGNDNIGHIKLLSSLG